MGLSESIDYKDSFVAVRRYHTSRLSKGLVRNCYCCKEGINDCRAVILINNHKYIPNVLLHEVCFDECEDKVALCADIENKYHEFEHLRSTFNY